MSETGSEASGALIDVLLALRQRSSKGLHFLPFYHLRQALTRPVIANEVDRICSQKYQKPRIVDIILQHGLRTFAVLVLLRQEKLILDFIENLDDQLDNKLPFEQAQINRISSKVSERFCAEVQWELIPHLFQSGGFHRKIMDEIVLPYTKEKRIDEGSGGEVFECVIAAGQHNLIPRKQPVSTTVIRKRIKMIKHRESNEQTFRKELQCLELLRCIQHGNIIDLLASYEQNGEYYLLFPKLSMNLADFLKEDNRFEEFKNSLTFFKALSGLASAIETVHNLSVESEEFVVSRIGYHHDIRPKNILVTHNTFVLTDFGLARLKMPDEGSRTQWISTVGDYIAPECMDDNFNRKFVGRSIDIWALGCLITEVATYMESGKDGVQEFREKRRQTSGPQRIKNSRFFKGDALRSSVLAWLDSMNSGLREPGITCLLETITLTLQVNPEVRLNACEVSKRLLYISTKMVYRSLIEILHSNDTGPHEKDSMTSPYERLGLWFEVEKVKAWGNVLGMEDNRTYQDLFLNESAIASNLSRTLEVFHKELSPYALESPNDKGTATVSRTHEGTPPTRPISAIVKDMASQLWEQVPLIYQIRMDQAWRQSSLNTEDIPRLAMIEESSRMLPKPFSEIGKNAALKRLTLKFWKEGQGSAPNQQRLLIKSGQIERGPKLSEVHEVGWFERYNYPVQSESEQKRVRVFIEWVLYSPLWEAQTDEEKILKILGLAEILNLPKPKGFQVLDCVGVVPPGEEVHHPGFGFVYSYPAFVSEKSNYDVATLAELFRQKDLVVLLEYKFSIAARICTSIYHLHLSNWLHKNLRASNIIFFMEQKSTRGLLGVEFLEPYLVGFQHSRPDGEIWNSDNDWHSSGPSECRHPDYTPGKTRFDKAYDYYSVGIVLLEVGFWEPITSFRTRHRDLPKHAFRDVLIKRYAPKLGPKMGSVYMNLVISCLSGDIRPELHGQSSGDVSDDYYWSVVAPLSQLKIV